MSASNAQPSIDIGNPDVWVSLYAEMAFRDETLLGTMNQATTALENIQSLTVNLTDATSETKPEPVEDMLSRTHEIGEAVTLLQLARERSFEAYEKVSSIYGEIGFKEWELGCELEDVAPALYVTRAIGDSHPFIVKRYRQVRAQIEIFRQLTARTDEDVTLGTETLDSRWAVAARMNATRNIQQIQIAQIALSAYPMDHARHFGKGIILSRIGLPTEVEPSEVGQILEAKLDNTWFASAVELTRRIEPVENGLLIDV